MRNQQVDQTVLIYALLERDSVGVIVFANYVYPAHSLRTGHSCKCCKYARIAYFQPRLVPPDLVRKENNSDIFVSLSLCRCVAVSLCRGQAL